MADAGGLVKQLGVHRMSGCRFQCFSLFLMIYLILVFLETNRKGCVYGEMHLLGLRSDHQGEKQYVAGSPMARSIHNATHATMDKGSVLFYLSAVVHGGEPSLTSVYCMESGLRGNTALHNPPNNDTTNA